MPLLARDDFNRPNVSPIGFPWVGNGYAGRIAAISSNVIIPDPGLLDTTAYHVGIPWPNDQWSFADLTLTSTGSLGAGPGVCVRQDGPGHATFGYWLVASHNSGNNVKIWQAAGAGFVSLLDINQAWTDGDNFGLRASGSVGSVLLEAYWKGALIGSVTDTDAVNGLGTGNPGVVYSSSPTGASMDNWTGGSGDFSLTPQEIGETGPPFWGG